MKNEQWKTINETPCCVYEVSDKGRVRITHKKGCAGGKAGSVKVFYGYPTKHGYLNLCFGNVHHLVAQAFIPNPNNYTEVNHKDEDKHNNTVENLEWCSSNYNANYGTRNQRIKKPIVQLTMNGEYVAEYDSATDALLALGILKQTISSCCHGHRKSAGGYKWMFKRDYIEMTKDCI